MAAKKLLYHEVGNRICAIWTANNYPEWDDIYRFDAGPDGISGNKEGFYFADQLMPFKIPFYINGVAITPTHFPECIDTKILPCSTCHFFSKYSCPIIADSKNMELTREGFKVYKEWIFVPRGIIPGLNNVGILLIDTAWKELLSHGRPLHFSLLAKIITARYPYINFTERKLNKLLVINPILFISIGEGVFQVVKDAKPNLFNLEDYVHKLMRLKYGLPIDQDNFSSL